MLRLGHITQEEHDAAQAEPITLNVTEISGSGVDVYSQPYFVAYVKQLLEQEFSTDVLFKGGLTVKTTIDPTMQQVAENASASSSTRSHSTVWTWAWSSSTPRPATSSAWWAATTTTPTRTT